MERSPIQFKEAVRVEILTLMDNYVDVLLPGTEIAKRPALAKDGKIPTDALLAEHGLSLLVTVYDEEGNHTILFDTGYSRVGVPHNMKLLNVNLNDIEAIVVSHGHMDHTGSLYSILEQIPHPVPLILHPEVFQYPRYFGLPDGRKLLFPKTLDRKVLKNRGVEIKESKAPVFLAGGMIAVTGEVERVTDFEKGLPNALMEKNGKMEKDPISDDMGIVINLKAKGLIVLSGCSHAGIINTILHAIQMTGVNTVYGVFGGFHLSGPTFEPIIEQTIVELKKIRPQFLVPMHCTGWNAIQRFAEEFPNAFVLNSVGTKFEL